jgi:hypothetical protein
MNIHSQRIHIDERLAASMRKGGFKIKHIAQTFRVSEFKIHCVLKKYPDAVSPINHRLMHNNIEKAIAVRRQILDWCPEEHKDFYRRLSCSFGSKEARRIVERDILGRAL